jgi:hypothetical protein
MIDRSIDPIGCWIPSTEVLFTVTPGIVSTTNVPIFDPTTERRKPNNTLRRTQRQRMEEEREGGRERRVPVYLLLYHNIVYRGFGFPDQIL